MFRVAYFTFLFLLILLNNISIANAINDIGQDSFASIDNRKYLITEVSSLPPPSIETIGIREENISDNLWKGLGRRRAEMLIESIKLENSSPTLRELYIKLMETSSSSIPKGDGEYINFIDLRVKKLIEIGEIDKALNMIDFIPEKNKTGFLREAEAYIYMQKSDYQKACDKVNANLTGKINIWNGYLLLCQFINNEHAKAGLTLSMIRGSGILEEKLYEKLDNISKGNSNISQEVINELLVNIYDSSSVSKNKYMFYGVDDKELTINDNLIKIITDNNNIDSQILNWWEENTNADNTKKSEYLSRLYFFLEENGVDISHKEWQKILHYSNFNRNITIRNIIKSSEDNRVGESIILILKLFGSQKPSDMDDLSLSFVQESLAKIGMNNFAISLAEESLNM